MNRIFRHGLTHLLVAATILVVPMGMKAAIAQDFPLLDELELTEAQRAEIRDILEARRGEIDELLTDEQQEQFREAYQEAGDLRGALSEVDNLTEEQRQGVRAVAESSREDIRGVLTEEQQAELRTIIQQQRGSRR